MPIHIWNKNALNHNILTVQWLLTLYSLTDRQCHKITHKEITQTITYVLVIHGYTIYSHICSLVVPVNDLSVLKRGCSCQSHPHTPLKWHHMAFFCFPSFVWKWKVLDLTQTTSFKRMWWQNWILPLKISFPRISNVYLNAVITVFGTYRTIFREMINKHKQSIMVFIIFNIITFLHHCEKYCPLSPPHFPPLFHLLTSPFSSTLSTHSFHTTTPFL